MFTEWLTPVRNGNECSAGVGRVAVKNIVARFVRNESGATAIEYALIAGILSIVLVASMIAIATELNAIFTDVEGGLKKRA